MIPLNWIELTRQQIKARHGFGWSIKGIEKQNRVLTKIVYRFSTGWRTTEAVKHYISYRMTEGRGTDGFNAESYLNNYADLRNAFVNDHELAT